MKTTFRIECPHCGWGAKWRDRDINMGWVRRYCIHCKKEFFIRIAIQQVRIDVEETKPEDTP